MQLIKTVQKFVSGSLKTFDIFSCIVSEVEETTDSKSRKMIRLKINDKEYQGLHSKAVYDFLCANEGTDSFVVLWKSPKGDYMVAYSWDLWNDHLTGKSLQVDSPGINCEKGEAFVYLWYDRINDKRYLGKHKGSPDDGYTGSGEAFLVEYNQRPQDFTRIILAYGSDEQMLHLETILILQLNAAKSPLFYNLSTNLRL